MPQATATKPQSINQTKKAHKKWNFISKYKNGIQYPGSLSPIQPFWEVTWGCILSKQWKKTDTAKTLGTTSK